MALYRYDRDHDGQGHDDYQDYTKQGAMKRLAFPAEAQECIWRVGVAHKSDQIHSKENISCPHNFSPFIYLGACLGPPSWEHPLQCT